MNTKQYKNIVAIETDPGKYLGFHSVNLEMAELDQEAWDQIQKTDITNKAIAELEEWSSELSPDASDSELSKTRDTLTLNVAEVCNLNCDYCGAGGDGSFSGTGSKKIDVTRATKQVAMFLDKLSPGETFHIRFIGGEPTLYPGAIKNIYKFAELYVIGRNIKVVYSIVTNGTLITPKVARLLADMNTAVFVSIDGAPEQNDISRPTKGSKGSTALTVRGIEELLNVRKDLHSLNFNCTFSVKNTDVISAYTYLKQFSPDKFSFSFATSPNDDEANKAYNQELRKLAEIVYEESGIQGLEKITSFALVMQTLATQIRKKLACGTGASGLHSDTLGRYYTCLWSINSPQKAVGQDDIILQEKLNSWVPSIDQKANKCHTCWARYMCGGECEASNLAKTGDSQVKDSSYCRTSMNIIEIGLKYYSKYILSNNETPNA